MSQPIPSLSLDQCDDDSVLIVHRSGRIERLDADTVLDAEDCDGQCNLTVGSSSLAGITHPLAGGHITTDSAGEQEVVAEIMHPSEHPTQQLVDYLLTTQFEHGDTAIIGFPIVCCAPSTETETDMDEVEPIWCVVTGNWPGRANHRCSQQG